MICCRQTNNMMNNLNERALRIALNHNTSDFATLLQKSNDVSGHHKNIQILMTEVYLLKYEITPPIVDSILNKINITYNFRTLQEFHSERKRTVFYGRKTMNV